MTISLDGPRGFIAVDLGGQSGRVLLGTFTGSGLVLDEAHRFVNRPANVDGLLCWDTDRLFDETLTGLASAVSIAASRGATVEGIGVDSWGVDYGLVGREGDLVAPVRHHRAGEARHVAMGHDRVPADEAYARTGIIESTINTCFQLVRDVELDLLSSEPTVLLTADLWTFWLTGTRAAERTLASTTGMLDWGTGDWAFDLLERWGIPTTTMPRLVSAGSPAGQTTDTVSERIGLSVPVFHVASHDTASAFAAVVSADEPVAVISCGTWALVGCRTSEPVLTDEAMAAGFTNEEGIDGSVVFVRNLSGTWLLEECLREWASEDGTQDVSALRSRLLADAGAITAASSVVTIDPGAPELIDPGGMPQRIAGIHRRLTGDDRSVSRPEIVRLILESLAASFASTITTAGRLTARPCTEVRMIGGGSRIDLLVALTERAVALPVRIGHAEATSIGSIAIQSVAAGVFATLDDARRQA